jgi:hypothetical protein
LISWCYVDVFQIFGEVLGNSNNQENLYGTFRDILEFVVVMSSRLSVFRRVKFKLKRSHLQTIYISFISSLMEYDDIVCDNIPDYLKQFFESLQLEAARIVTGGTKLTSR